jgi:hypothetical protein
MYEEAQSLFAYVLIHRESCDPGTLEKMKKIPAFSTYFCLSLVQREFYDLVHLEDEKIPRGPNLLVFCSQRILRVGV